MQKLVSGQKKIVVSNLHGKLDVRELQKKAPPLSEKLAKEARDEIEQANKGRNPWASWNTPLEYYAERPMFDVRGKKRNFKSYLTSFVRTNEKVRILDVGGGSLKQWKKFLHKHRNVEFYSIVLTKKVVVPEMKRYAIVCGADRIDEVFPPSYFHMTVSFYGMQGYDVGGLRAAERLVMKGGELVFSWVDREVLYNEKVVAEKFPSLEIIGFEKGHGITAHLRKLA